MLLERSETCAVIQRRHKQACNAIDRLNDLLAAYERESQIYEEILQDLQSGELPETFALEKLEQMWGAHGDDDQSPQKPDELRLPIYKDKSLATVILSIFDELNSSDSLEISINGLAKRIYTAKTRKNINACKSSLTAVLNRCVNSNELKRVRPGVFIRNFEKRDKSLTELYRQGGFSID